LSKIFPLFNCFFLDHVTVFTAVLALQTATSEDILDEDIIYYYLDEAFDDVERDGNYPADEAGHTASGETGKYSAAVRELPVSSIRTHRNIHVVLCSIRAIILKPHSHRMKWTEMEFGVLKICASFKITY